jgi:two-component system, sensor histidine kinase and response regulator
MLVDDEQANLELFSAILEEEGYRTLSSRDASLALKLLESSESSKPDLIISDIYMPEMGGFEFYEKVQGIPELRSVPFIFLSALSDRAHVREGKELGADDYLTKPIDIDELVTTVRGKLKRAASMRSAMQSEFEALKEQVLSTLSHELNTPLTYIIGFSEIISSAASSITTDELKEFADLIHHGGGRLKNLVDDFLITIQIDSGQTSSYYETDKKKFDLAKSIPPLKDEYSALAAEKGTEFVVKTDKELQVTASETLIRDIIARLLSNAVKFTTKGSVTLAAFNENEQVKVEVSDTGVGLPEQELPKICDKFYQVNKGKQQQQGAGLGLYIAKNLADINRCKLEISSIENSGTKVTLLIPT